MKKKRTTSLIAKAEKEKLSSYLHNLSHGGMLKTKQDILKGMGIVKSSKDDYKRGMKMISNWLAGACRIPDHAKVVINQVAGREVVHRISAEEERWLQALGDYLRNETVPMSSGSASGQKLEEYVAQFIYHVVASDKADHSSFEDCKKHFFNWIKWQR